MIDQRQTHGAPVVVERNPTYYNLVGQVEYRATFGAMVTGFQHITPGAFHRANGGFLILHALDVLTAPFTWEALTRGQINGVTIADLDDYAFGLPVPITARIALGHGTVQSIEREVKLSGPIHAKGMVTLAGYLAAQSAQDWPLALQATVTFEQSYDEIEGDSAAAAELYALLSTLADLPLQQGITVIGSVNQHSAVQAVGGVTRKIEGFSPSVRKG